MSKICKIIYFDEESVTDYVQIIAGGSLEKTTELLNTRNANESQSGEANGKIGFGSIFKTLTGINASASANISAGLSFNSEKMIKNILKNTILTDFLDIIKKDSNKSKSMISKLSGYKITVEPNSFSYMIMVSPYFNMLKNESVIPAGDFNIATDKLDMALKNAKGYYEFIGTKKKEKIILRFNINAFRNHYTISDLLKMDLSVYAIKVGSATLEDLDIEKELGLNFFKNKVNPSYESSNEVNKGEGVNTSLDVYDVLLAGVEAE